LILSGVIVKFEKLNPIITVQKKVPLTGEIMASKWAFEALAVNQFKNNAFNKQFYYIDKDIKTTSFRKNFWLSRLKDRLNFIDTHLEEGGKVDEIAKAQTLLYNEINKENKRNSDIQYNNIDKLIDGEIKREQVDELKVYLDDINNYYIKEYNRFSKEKDQLLIGLNKTQEQKESFIKLKNDYTNESLEDLVTNKNDLEKIIEWNNELIQRADPIYKDPIGFRAHFLAPSKKVFDNYITTFSANIIVLWIFSIVLAVTLYYDALRNLLESLARLFKKKKKR
jgi:hypothetical protein